MTRYDVAIITLALSPVYVIIAWAAARDYGLAAGIFYAVFWYVIMIVVTRYWVRYVDKRNKEL